MRENPNFIKKSSKEIEEFCKIAGIVPPKSEKMKKK